MLTPYQTEKNEEIYCFEDDEDERRRRKTKTKDEDERRRRRRSKRTEEGKKRFQNKCELVPKPAVIRKEEGATAAASHLPSLQAGPAAFFHGNLHLCGKAPLTTANVLLTNERKT